MTDFDLDAFIADTEIARDVLFGGEITEWFHDECNNILTTARELQAARKALEAADNLADNLFGSTANGRRILRATYRESRAAMKETQ